MHQLHCCWQGLLQLAHQHEREQVPAFDLQYMRMMLQDHQQAIELLTAASQSTDPEVRAYALKTLPAKSHFNHARSVHNRAY
ncbi:DUF4142 domain-containing protein [Paradesertivirga mongoliensis]|uniref:DUF4142 domain-containing protein n=1 Tax=Paradesertivirga mongoliensis TaxID=2100740 RepID=A0ABW4ZN58_9SPHI|nr:DUF4142 domain-containing protein [Pedobacter mongoliensis]